MGVCKFIEGSIGTAESEHQRDALSSFLFLLLLYSQARKRRQHNSNKTRNLKTWATTVWISNLQSERDNKKAYVMGSSRCQAIKLEIVSNFTLICKWIRIPLPEAQRATNIGPVRWTLKVDAVRVTEQRHADKQNLGEPRYLFSRSLEAMQKRVKFGSSNIQVHWVLAKFNHIEARKLNITNTTLSVLWCLFWERTQLLLRGCLYTLQYIRI